MPIAFLISEEEDLKRKVKKIRDRLHEIADNQDGPDPSDTDNEERQLQGRLQFLAAELKQLLEKKGRRKPKYKEVQPRFKKLTADGMRPMQAIRQIAEERGEDEDNVKGLVNYRPKLQIG